MNNVNENWIPCQKGQMPEDIIKHKSNAEYPSINVLITTKNRRVTKAQRYKYKDTWYWSRGLNAIAWRTLPEPYKERK